MERLNIKQSQPEGGLRVEISLHRNCLPTDKGIEEKLVQGVLDFKPKSDQVGLSIEKFGQFILEHNPKSDQEIWVDDPEKLGAATAYMKTELAKLPIREGGCDCDDPYCPRKAPISPMALYLIGAQAPETKVLAMEKWQPFDYPIIVVDKNWEPVLGIVVSAASRYIPTNMIRMAISCTTINSPAPARAFILSRIFDLVEAIYFPDEVPTQFEIASNSLVLPIRTTGRYNFIGLALQMPFSAYTVEFSQEPEKEIKFMVIGFYFGLERIFKSLQNGVYQVTVSDGNRSFQFESQRDIGMWKPVGST